IVAEPQAQFLYVLDGNGQLSAFSVSSDGVLTLAGNPISDAFVGGNSGGVGDPFSFAAGGARPVWQNFCTLGGDHLFPLDGCFHPPLFSSGPGTSGRTDTGSSPQPRAATFALHVVIISAGGAVQSSPAGIDIDPLTGGDAYDAAFADGGSVTLTASP